MAGMVRFLAMRRPHVSATPASTGKMRSPAQAGKSVSSHAMSRVRRRPSPSIIAPFRISPRVRTLTNIAVCGVARNHSETWREGLGLSSSDSTQVSIRKLTGRYHAEVTCRAQCPGPHLPERKPAETQSSMVAGASDGHSRPRKERLRPGGHGQ